MFPVEVWFTDLVWVSYGQEMQWDLGHEGICGHSVAENLVLVVYSVDCERFAFPFFLPCGALWWRRELKIQNDSQGDGIGMPSHLHNCGRSSGTLSIADLPAVNAERQNGNFHL